ncbi:uncharacterized protein LOC122382282 [Amphibalanus amphitrite]|uniref:uncharacterized protein LOC122382282 n=1 Tax=Amphibalanus amphitrite TaxID=1232801 RepID=UPI001C8FDEA0|nr:uncharacterized protein LOC122382282 [Amphibalanus amphitrite]
MNRLQVSLTVVLAVALVGVTADDDGQYTQHYHQPAVQYHHQPAVQHYSAPKTTRRPVGGPAPADAVQKATQQFHRLYKEAAARAAAAPDDNQSYQSVQYHHQPTVQYHSGPKTTRRPVGGPAPADAVQKATQQFHRLYKEAAAAPDDQQIFASQHVQQQPTHVQHQSTHAQHLAEHKRQLAEHAKQQAAHVQRLSAHVQQQPTHVQQHAVHVQQRPAHVQQPTVTVVHSYDDDDSVYYAPY